MWKDLKNTVTNIIGFIIILIPILQYVIELIPEDATWTHWVMAILMGIVAYTTGKDMNIK